MVSLLHDRHAQAHADLNGALAGFRALDDRWGMIVTLSTHAEAAYRTGDVASAAAPWRRPGAGRAARLHPGPGGAAADPRRRAARRR
ncbi:hypothetical protein V2I01_38050 [Micromonospora sp. BRA006-A]|nr:hypothetical protein [Micromonospora sp. BRA006-A]